MESLVTNATSAASVAHAQLPDIYGHSRKVYALEFNCNGSQLASGSNDKTIRVWDVNSFCGGHGKDHVELRGHADSIHSLAWDPTAPHRLASTGADKTVRIWDTKSGKISHTISLENEGLNIVYSHDGKYIAVSNLGSVTLVDARKHRVLLSVLSPEVNEVQFSKSGFLFVAAGHPAGYGTFEIMKIVTGKKGIPNLEIVQKVVAHAGSCFCLDFHPSGRYVAIGGVDSLVSLWDLEELYCVRTYAFTTSSIRTVRFNHNGDFLAVGMDDTNLVVLRTDTGEHALTVSLRDELQYLCWHPSKNLLAYVGDKATTGDRNSSTRDGVIKWVEIKGP